VGANPNEHPAISFWTFERTVGGLQPDTVYVARAIGRNQAGGLHTGQSNYISFRTSPAGGQPPPPPPPTVPGIPTLAVPVPGDRSVTLTWTAPNNGGSPITRYHVSTDNGNSWMDVGLTTTFTVGNLINGVAYTFRVRAVNAIGAGAWSASRVGTPRAPDASVLSISPDIRDWAPGAAQTERTIGLRSNTTWQARSDSTGWLTVTPQNGSGDTPIVIGVRDNLTGGVRHGTITLTAGNEEIRIVVSQANGIEIFVNGNGGTPSVNRLVITGNTAGNVLDGITVSRPGFVFARDFAGWYTSQTRGSEITPNRQLQNGATIYARWYVNVTLDPMGGVIDSTTRRMISGSGISILPGIATFPTPARTFDIRGHGFDGWSLTPGGQPIPDGITVPNEHTTFYALWSMIWHRDPRTNDWNNMIPDGVGFWPGGVSIYTEILCDPREFSSGFPFHTMVQEASRDWATALDISITHTPLQHQAQILAFAVTEARIALILNIEIDEITFNGIAFLAPSTPAGTVFAGGAERPVLRQHGQSIIYTVYSDFHGLGVLNIQRALGKVTHHEVGHALGWRGHPYDIHSNRNDIMFPGFIGRTGYTLTANEIRHLRQIYDWGLGRY